MSHIVPKLPPPPDCDPSELELDDAFGEHSIEYWVWSGKRLVPATAEHIATIHEMEERLHLTRSALLEDLHDEDLDDTQGVRCIPRMSPGHGMVQAATQLLSLFRRRLRPSEAHPT
jgi:hypothetical protein